MGRDPSSLGASSAPATGEHGQGSRLRAPACLPLPAAWLFDACVPRPGRAGPCLGRHDSPTFRLWVPEGRGVGGAAAGTRPGPPACPLASGSSLPIQTLLSFDLRPSIHCPQSSDGETEAREQKSCVGSGQGASGSWSGILLALPQGTEPLVLPFDPPLLSGSRRPAILGMAQTGWLLPGVGAAHPVVGPT